MRKNIEQRVAAIEKRCLRPVVDIKVKTATMCYMLGRMPRVGIVGMRSIP